MYEFMIILKIMFLISYHGIGWNRIETSIRDFDIDRYIIYKPYILYEET